MEVSKDILEVWRKFTENGEYHGEMNNLIERSGLNYRTVRKAIETGKCSAKVHNTINRAASDIILEIRESAKILKDLLHTPIA